MEEGATFKKDITPYLVFACTKCHQFSYVKTTQKTKKCLRCRRTYQVKDILDKGEIVKGITAAMNRVKEKQNQLGIPDLTSENEFHLAGDFKFKLIVPSNKEKINFEDENDKYEKRFQKLLNEVGATYSKFPKYLIKSLAEKYQIPQKEIANLIRKFKKKRILTQLNNGYFKIANQQNSMNI